MEATVAAVAGKPGKQRPVVTGDRPAGPGRCDGASGCADDLGGLHKPQLEIRLAAIQMLGQIDSPEAYNRLGCSRGFPHPSQRSRACRLSTLVGATPWRVRGRVDWSHSQAIQVSNTAGQRTRSVGVLFVEGERFNVRRLYEFQPITDPSLSRQSSTPSVPLISSSAENLLMAMAGTGNMELCSALGWLASVTGRRNTPSDSARSTTGLRIRQSLAYNSRGVPSLNDLQFAWHARIFGRRTTSCNRS